MASKRGLIFPLAVAGVAAIAYRVYRAGALDRLVASVRTHGMPSAGVYDWLVSPAMGDFYRRVVGEVAPLAPQGTFLDVGSGPGRLAVRLAETAPNARVTGVDIAPDMVARANQLAERFGLAARAKFVVGDVADLPFPSESFDVAVSTLSMHHWADPAKGLREIHRVLRPGGVARIYDVANWLRHVEQKGPPAPELAASSPFGGASVEPFFQVGPLPIVLRLAMRRPGD